MEFKNKSQKDLTFEDFFHGQLFEGDIKQHVSVRGHVAIERGKIYLCQDLVDGSRCDNTQGHTYSYVISESRNVININDNISGLNVSKLILPEDRNH